MSPKARRIPLEALTLVLCTISCIACSESEPLSKNHAIPDQDRIYSAIARTQPSGSDIARIAFSVPQSIASVSYCLEQNNESLCENDKKRFSNATPIPSVKDRKLWATTQEVSLAEGMVLHVNAFAANSSDIALLHQKYFIKKRQDGPSSEGVLLGTFSSDRKFDGQMLTIRVTGSLSSYPRTSKIANFQGYPQTASTSCGPNAIRNALKPVVGVLYDDRQLFDEAIEADHAGLKSLENELRQATGGFINPATLSSRGTTPIGNAFLFTKYLSQNAKPLVGAFASIPKWDDRLLLLVDRISKGYPVAVPFVEGDYNHWVTAYGYDLDAKVINVVNGGGDISFDKFDSMNSFKSPPGGLMGRIFNVSNKHGLGANVLVFIWQK